MTKKWMAEKYLGLFLRHSEHFLMTPNPHISVIAFNSFAHNRFVFVKS
jgi:hypothetical protein